MKDETATFLSVTPEQTGSNGQSSNIRYSFDMFRFTFEPHDLFLHCVVHLCSPDDEKPCIPVSLVHLLALVALKEVQIFHAFKLILKGDLMIMEKRFTDDTFPSHPKCTRFTCITTHSLFTGVQNYHQEGSSAGRSQSRPTVIRAD